MIRTFFVALLIASPVFAQAETAYVRCRAIAPNGGWMPPGEYERVNGNVQSTARQAWRNYVNIFCGGPFGDQCARPVDCYGHDSNLNELGVVFSQ